MVSFVRPAAVEGLCSPSLSSSGRWLHSVFTFLSASSYTFMVFELPVCQLFFRFLMAEKTTKPMEVCTAFDVLTCSLLSPQQHWDPELSCCQGRWPLQTRLEETTAQEPHVSIDIASEARE